MAATCRGGEVSPFSRRITRALLIGLRFRLALPEGDDAADDAVDAVEAVAEAAIVDAATEVGDDETLRDSV